MIKRHPRHQRSRTAVLPNNRPPGAGIGTTFSISSAKALLTFDSPVIVNDLPNEITRQAAGAGPQLLPIDFDQTSPTTLLLTYAASVVATDKLTIPASVPEVRGTAGGFLAAAVHTF